MHAQFLLVFTGWLLILGACVLAWRLGGQAERQVAVLVLIMSLAITLIAMLPNREFQRLSYLLVDGLFGAGLMVLALRHAATWLGIAVLLQAVQFALHAYYLVAAKAYDDLYALANNVVSLGVLLCLVAGALLAWRRRRRTEAK